MILSNKMTDLTIKWIADNRYQEEIKNLATTADFKRWMMKKVLRYSEPSKSFIAGAKLVNWDSLLAVYKSIDS